MDNVRTCFHCCYFYLVVFICYDLYFIIKLLTNNNYLMILVFIAS